MSSATAPSDDFVLKWNNHKQNFVNVVEELWRQDIFTDVVLCTEGRIFPAHRVILSACSVYFYETLSKVSEHQYPVIFLNGVSSEELAAILKFVYHGEVVVSKECMQDFFRTAEMLQIKGLASSQMPHLSQQPVGDRYSREVQSTEDREPSDIEYQQRFRTTSQSTLSPEPFDLTVAREPVYPVVKTSVPFQLGQLPTESHPVSPVPHPTWIANPVSQTLAVPSTATPPRRGRPPLDASPGLSRVQVPAVHGAGPSTVIQPPPSSLGRSPSSGPDQQQVVRVTVMTPQGLMTMFQCPYCAKRFRRRDHLRQHIRTHTGEKPFACDVCGRRFSQSQQVRIHMRVHMDPVTPSGSGKTPARTKSTSYEGPQMPGARRESESERGGLDMGSPGLFPTPLRYSPVPGSSGDRAIDLSSPLKADDDHSDKACRKRPKFFPEAELSQMTRRDLYQSDTGGHRVDFRPPEAAAYGENCRDSYPRDVIGFRRVGSVNSTQLHHADSIRERDETWEFRENREKNERSVSPHSETS